MPVVEVSPGPDGLVRVVKVKVVDKVYKRSIRHLIKMPVDVNPHQDDTDPNGPCGGECLVIQKGPEVPDTSEL